MSICDFMYAEVGEQHLPSVCVTQFPDVALTGVRKDLVS